MTTTISSKGQVVLPAALRRKLALQPGDTLSIKLERIEGEPRIVIQPQPSRRKRMRIKRDPATGWPVLVGPPGSLKLTTEMVKEMMADFP